MTPMTKTAAALMTAAFIAGGPALASDRAAIDSCRAEIAAETSGVSAGDISFSSIAGASVRRVSFEVRTAEGVETVTCKYKRGDVVDVAWAGGDRFADKR